MTARRSRIRKVQQSSGTSQLNRTSFKKKLLAIGFIILGVIILIATITTVIVMLMQQTNSSVLMSENSKGTRCIYPDFNNQKKLHSGVEIAVSNIPWQVQILVDDKNACEGTILDKSTILSAAECFENQYSPSIVRAGSIRYGNGGQVSYSYEINILA